MAGGLLGLYAPWESDILDGLQWAFLVGMVFLVVVSLPLLSVGRAIAKPRVLVALFAVNLLVVPLVVFILSRFVFQVPELQVGLLLVLLAPGVALSLTTAQEAGGDVESVLGAKPLILIGQLVVVPLYTVLLSGGVLGFSDLPPTFSIIGGAIVAPAVAALLVQGLMTRFARLASTRERLTSFRVPVISVAVALVLWNQVPAHLAELEELYRVVPLFFAFLVLLQAAVHAAADAFLQGGAAQLGDDVAGGHARRIRCQRVEAGGLWRYYRTAVGHAQCRQAQAVVAE